jgi:superoxide dismutase, Fe-Mn family
MTSKDRNIIGNFEVSEGEVKTRREVLVMGALAAGTIVSSGAALAQGNAIAAVTKSATPYEAKDFSALAAKNMQGLSANQINQHLKLYQGYVGKINEIEAKLKDVDINGANATYAPLRELLLEQSYALNGVVYHEFYFGNLGGSGGDPKGTVGAAIAERWGSAGKFMDYLKASGKSMRGWVIVGYNTRGGHLEAYGLDTHNMWVPANVVPVLVLDVYEHAYMIDYGIDRGKYLDAFVANLDWNVIDKRFSTVSKHPTGLASTV